MQSLFVAGTRDALSNMFGFYLLCGLGASFPVLLLLVCSCGMFFVACRYHEGLR